MPHFVGIMELTFGEKERKQAIKRYSEGERPVDIYRSIGRSKPWFMKWLRRYKTGRKDWYKDIPRKPKTIQNKTDERIEKAIVRIRKLLMDGSEDAERRLKMMLHWDVNNGIARRNWARNKGAVDAIKRAMKEEPLLKVTLPNMVDDDFLDGF